MIVSENTKPHLIEFKTLMEKTDIILNDDAQRRPQYYATRAGNPLEDDVLAALIEGAAGTPFENTIRKVSGQKFPDIIAAKYYGVEVKSTKEDHWTSTGSSILETTRIQDVERIYMTFGKLGGVPSFKSKPYEECLSGIAVTHMPRYLIDMRITKEETIFSKLGIPYDELRKMDNPIAPVSKYYRSKLKPGETLWWAGDSANETVSATVSMWRNIDEKEKIKCKVYGMVNYPEIFRGDYDRYALWLASQGIVDSHIRDQFSAGGQEDMFLSDGTMYRFPGSYRRIKKYKDYISYVMSLPNTSIIIENTHISSDQFIKRMKKWFELVSKNADVNYDLSMDALNTLFFG